MRRESSGFVQRVCCGSMVGCSVELAGVRGACFALTFGALAGLSTPLGFLLTYALTVEKISFISLLGFVYLVVKR